MPRLRRSPFSLGSLGSRVEDPLQKSQQAGAFKDRDRMIFTEGWWNAFKKKALLGASITGVDFEPQSGGYVTAQTGRFTESQFVRERAQEHDAHIIAGTPGFRTGVTLDSNGNYAETGTAVDALIPLPNKESRKFITALVGKAARAAIEDNMNIMHELHTLIYGNLSSSATVVSNVLGTIIGRASDLRQPYYYGGSNYVMSDGSILFYESLYCSYMTCILAVMHEYYMTASNGLSVATKKAQRQEILRDMQVRARYGVWSYFIRASEYFNSVPRGIDHITSSASRNQASGDWLMSLEMPSIDKIPESTYEVIVGNSNSFGAIAFEYETPEGSQFAYYSSTENRSLQNRWNRFVYPAQVLGQILEDEFLINASDLMFQDYLATHQVSIDA